MGRPKKSPIYVLPHGIEVIGEYAPNKSFSYWRVRVRPHPLITGKIVHGGVEIRRSRAVLTSRLGRILTPQDIAHHSDENKENDSPGNIESTNSFAHNSHHKTGFRHSQESTLKISSSLKTAYATGRKARPKAKDQAGEKNANAKLTRPQILEIRASELSTTTLAKLFKVSPRNIRLIKNGDTWK